MIPEIDLPATLFPSAGPDWAIFAITWFVRIGALSALLVVLFEVMVGMPRRGQRRLQSRPAEQK